MNENQYFIVKYTHHYWQPPIHSCEFKTGIEMEALSKEVKKLKKESESVR